MSPVRRTAIFIEQSIYNGIQWAVFEPNDFPLWGALRSNIGAFMNGLFRRGLPGRYSQRLLISCAADWETP